MRITLTSLVSPGDLRPAVSFPLLMLSLFHLIVPPAPPTFIVHDTRFLDPSYPDPPPSLALVILNSDHDNPTTPPKLPAMLDHLFAISSYAICADGGANRLYDMTEGLRNSDGVGVISRAACPRVFPNAIKGDMDSIRSDVRGYYTSAGVSVVEDDGMDTNDLEKCLWEVNNNVQVRSN